MSKSEDTLEEIANIVYYGGLDGLTENDALEQIRELVYPWVINRMAKIQRDWKSGIHGKIRR